MGDVVILLCAAGASRRMRGGDKLLEPVAGLPLLRRQALAALKVAPVIVTLPPDRPLRRRALEGLALRQVEVADAAEGLAASIRAGVAAANDGAALMVMLADMPEVGAGDLAALVAAHARAPEAVIRAAGADGTPGHPALFPARMLPALAKLQGDTGARDLLRAEAPVLVPLPGRRALTDLDTPEDWAEWRARTGL